MKLYYVPGACSLANHIALHEAGLIFEVEMVHLGTRQTESGSDYTKINSKGKVPALVLPTGETLTENIAILDWIAGQSEALKPSGSLGHARLLEILSFISTEVHKNFKPFFTGAGDDEKSKAAKDIQKQMEYLAGSMKGQFIFGEDLSVADCFLFVILLWAHNLELSVPSKLAAFRDRMSERQAVTAAMSREGLV